jgi:prevent-host-death family protein
MRGFFCAASPNRIRYNLVNHTVTENAMKTVAVFEAKTRLSEILASVEQGEQVTITRHGRPVARIVAANADESGGVPGTPGIRPDMSALIAAIKASRRGSSLEGIDIREAIEEGRD